MPKNFLWFLLGAQAIVTLLHWLIYELLLNFFPGLDAHKLALLIFMLVLSVSFLSFSLLTYSRDIFLLRWGYIISAVCIILVCYFAMAGALVVTVSLLTNWQLETSGYLAAGLALVLILYGIINPRITRVITIKVKLPNLPTFWKGKTAVMVSDLHLGQILRTGFARKIIKLINRQNPEIVLIPGDFYDGVHADFQKLADTFQDVKSVYGVYFCSGNHEKFAGYEKCETALKGAGVKILENQKVEIEGLQIAGVAYKKETMADLPQTLNSLNLDRNKPSILLKHVSLQLKEAAEAGISLMLSGHSHQGQIWPGQYITKKYFSGYDYGLNQFEKMWIYISSGAGTWGPPMRVFTKSEIVRIVFE